MVGLCFVYTDRYVSKPKIAMLTAGWGCHKKPQKNACMLIAVQTYACIFNRLNYGNIIRLWHIYAF